jgi:hypothetical protein
MMPFFRSESAGLVFSTTYLRGILAPSAVPVPLRIEDKKTSGSVSVTLDLEKQRDFALRGTGQGFPHR